jgi:serine protease Do
MHRWHTLARPTVALAALLLLALPAQAQQRFGKAVDEVNSKMVKIYGAGGFRNLTAYGTGIMVSPDGYILTVSSYLIENPRDLRVHLADGRRFDKIKVAVIEPELDMALLKIEDLPKEDKLPYFDVPEEGKRPVAATGTMVLAFSNQFEIATRNEPMSVQRSAVSSVSKLRARRGVNEVPYQGDVYVIDAIACNPGAAGGALTTRKGELLGVIGKELRNTLTDTWINYAMPLQATVEVGEKKEKVSLAKFVELGIQGKYKPSPPRVKPEGGAGGYTGIIMVPDPEGVAFTPPYIEEVRSNSPAAKEGLRADDLIVYINGELVKSVKTYKEILSKTQPKDEVTMEIRRGDKIKTVVLKLEQHPRVKK